MSVPSAIILIADLFAPTVPSDPYPQNLQLIVPSGTVFKFLVTSSDLYVTSSVIPIVNLFFGSSATRLS